MVWVSKGEHKEGREKTLEMGRNCDIQLGNAERCHLVDE
jgi:hypothetical protein